MKHHPDVNSGASAAAFQSIKDAYDTVMRSFADDGKRWWTVDESKPKPGKPRPVTRAPVTMADFDMAFFRSAMSAVAKAQRPENNVEPEWRRSSSGDPHWA